MNAETGCNMVIGETWLEERLAIRSGMGAHMVGFQSKRRSAYKTNLQITESGITYGYMRGTNHH